jgi:hypothetical protein
MVQAGIQALQGGAPVFIQDMDGTESTLVRIVFAL